MSWEPPRAPTPPPPATSAGDAGPSEWVLASIRAPHGMYVTRVVDMRPHRSARLTDAYKFRSPAEAAATLDLIHDRYRAEWVVSAVGATQAVVTGRPAGLHREGRYDWLIGLIAGVMITVGAFLPWAQIGAAARSGADGGGDGLFTAAFGIAGAIGCWAGGRGLFLAIVGGAIVTAIGIYDLTNLLESEFLEVGSGMYVTIGGGVVMTLAALSSRSAR